MLTGELPFGKGSERNIFEQMVELLGPLPVHMARTAEQIFAGFKYDDKQPPERTSSGSALKHMLMDKKPGLAEDEVDQVLDLITCMLQLSPEHRKSAKELVAHPWLQQ